MAQDLGPDLARLLDRYEENRRADRARAKQIEADERAFREGFDDLRRRVVRPVFEAAGAMLKARGHDFAISEAEFARDAAGHIAEAAMSIEVKPEGMETSVPGRSQFPSLAIVTRHYNKSVCILVSNAAPRSSGAAGSRGDYTLAQVSTELVESEFLKLMAGIVGA